MKLTLSNLETGTQLSAYQGKHRGESALLASNPLKTGVQTRSKSKLSRETIEEGEFAAQNPDRRGNRSKLEFRGNHPHRWNPARDFDPDKQGDATDGGAFKGGRDGNKKGGKKDYQKAFGDVKNTTRPFAPGKVPGHVRLKVKG